MISKSESIFNILKIVIFGNLWSCSEGQAGPLASPLTATSDPSDLDVRLRNDLL